MKIYPGKFFLSIILLLTFKPLAGQIIVNGKILNRDTKEAIAYANIGIPNENIGTISNLDGSFSLVVPKKFENDSLLFSALGFGRKFIPIKPINKNRSLVIYLVEKVTVLESITIKEKKEKNKIFILGNRKVKGGVLETDTTYSGRAMSLLIENKLQKDLSFPLYLVNARLRIYRNNLKSFKFRVRLNEIDTLTGLPGEDILQKSLVMDSSMKNGWLEFDFSGLKQQVVKPFFLTFEQLIDRNDKEAITNGYREWLRKYPERLKTDTVVFEGKKQVRHTFIRNGIDLPGTFIGISGSTDRYSCFVRETSFGEWKKVRGIISATVTVSNQVYTVKNEMKDNPCDDLVRCRVEKICRDFMDDTGLDGLQLSVSVGNKRKLSLALGYADIENGISTTDSTRFRINSISKAMTSAALIKLVSAEAGLIILS